MEPTLRDHIADQIAIRIIVNTGLLRDSSQSLDDLLESRLANPRHRLIPLTSATSARLKLLRPHLHLLLPTPTQGLIELDQSNEFVRLCLRQPQLRREGICLIRQYLQVVSSTGLETRLR